MAPPSRFFGAAEERFCDLICSCSSLRADVSCAATLTLCCPSSVSAFFSGRLPCAASSLRIFEFVGCGFVEVAGAADVVRFGVVVFAKDGSTFACRCGCAACGAELGGEIGGVVGGSAAEDVRVVVAGLAFVAVFFAFFSTASPFGSSSFSAVVFLGFGRLAAEELAFVDAAFFLPGAVSMGAADAATTCLRGRSRGRFFGMVAAESVIGFL